MNVGRLYANLTTRATRYEAGMITNPQQASACVAVRQLEDSAAKVAGDMLALDNKEFDLNQPTLNNVYLHAQNPSGFTGHAVRNEQGQLERLEADNGRDKYSVSVNGDHKEVRHTTTIHGPAGESPVVTEEWAIFNGTSVKHKVINY